jgi:hypothetical protein
MMKNEIIIYQADELPERLNVRVESDSVWLNRQQLSVLFGRDIKTIGKHVNNVFSEGELDRDATVAFFATVQNEGGRQVERKIEYYNLDVIISVGYRVKSIRGTQFRIWANRVLKDHLLKGYSLNRRMNRMENDIDSLTKRVHGIELSIHSGSLPSQGVFFDGQIYDAYRFIADLIRSAQRSLILIDNYVDDRVLTLFTKRNKGVDLTILTGNISKQLQLDVEKHNEQYARVKIQCFHKAHDRFLIIDEKDIYHMGASLKDLGKKWFAFSKLHINPSLILDKLPIKV